MKKFLVILLIAIIACKTVEEEALEQIMNGVKELYNKLKADGTLGRIAEILKTVGKAAAEMACCTYAPEFCILCGALLGLL